MKESLYTVFTNPRGLVTPETLYSMQPSGQMSTFPQEIAEIAEIATCQVVRK